LKASVPHPPKERVVDYFILRTKPEQLDPPSSADIQRELGLIIPRDDEIERE
jgi:hypothetical protein